MNVILLSGGSGKRLWPLSNDTRSKQFLKLLKNDNGEYESMVQRVYRQLTSVDTNANIVIATGAAQVDSIHIQLNNKVDIVVEPERRDTFPAIILACSYLVYEKGISPLEPVIVLPVDTYVQDFYFETLLEMENVIKRKEADIVLMGVKPTYPSEKYGYIMPLEEACCENNCLKKQKSRVQRVKYFIEKPSNLKAQEMINKGALWNGGVFGFQLQYILDILKESIQSESFKETYRKYKKLKKVSFDYEVVEKAKSVSVVYYENCWKDLGTWNTLSEEMADTSVGKVYLGEETENTTVVNELSVPVVVLGAKDMVIASSPDGILISDKQKSSYLKPYVEKFDVRPMYEERYWGEYTVVHYGEYKDGTKSLTKYFDIKAGKRLSYQSHVKRDEIWTIVNGWGEVILDGHIRNVRRGDIICIMKGQMHAIRAVTELHYIEIQIGNELVEEDIEKEEKDWEEKFKC